MTFTLFHKLPLEIRAAIWTEAAKIQHRIVEVHWASSEGFTFHTQTPALLSVCYESRAYTYSLYYGAHIRRKDSRAPFCFERDVLYMPYQSSCSTSYAVALDSFLSELKGCEEIRHLALSMPFPEKHPMDPSLERGSFSTQVQEMARQSFGLKLETLTLILGDPFMEQPDLNVDVASRGPQHESQPSDPGFKAKTESDIGVAKEFRDVPYGPEQVEAIKRIAQHFEQVLKKLHDRRDLNDLQVVHTSRDFNSWGPDLKILVKHADRIPGDYAIGTCSMKAHWVEAHKKKLRLIYWNVDSERSRPSSIV